LAKLLVSDELWAVVAPLLPPHRPWDARETGRRGIPDRACPTGIIFVLKTGIQWEDLPQELGCGSGMTCWRCLRDWQRAGVWRGLHQVLLHRPAWAGRIDWSRASADGTRVPAKSGGEATGSNPTDRGKPGAHHHLVTDRRGVPLAHAVEGFGLLGGGQRDAGFDRAGMPNARLAVLHGTTHYESFPSPALAAAVPPVLDAPRSEAR
jgi:transposase